MIPRTVQMAAAVAATFTPTQLEDEGNIILNGYLSSVPNTIGKKAWQYKETTTPPADLPSLVQIRPAMKGWTTNYMEYFTSGVNQGEPTMFEYVVHSYAANGASKWAQPPRLRTVTPKVDQPAVTGSFLYPRADSATAPLIDVL